MAGIDTTAGPRPTVAREGAIERVCLLIADLSGYTAYLANAEPDHAPAMAGDLVETVIRQLRPMFRLIKLEGDAAFLAAPLERVDGPMLLDAVEAADDAFGRRLTGLAAATTCDCESCKRVPQLDLKFVAHAGSVVRHRVAGREELGGTDAIIVHRLLKADAPAAAGVGRYLLFTDACAAALGLDPVALGATPAIERFEHIGEVPVHLLDLARRGRDAAPRWQAPRGTALARVELSVAAAPMTVWEELTSPHRRQAWEGLMRIDEEPIGGRRGVGTLSTCAAERLNSLEEILEWRPFEAFARRATRPGIGHLSVRAELRGDDTDAARTSLSVAWYGSKLSGAEAEAQRDRLLAHAASLREVPA